MKPVVGGFVFLAYYWTGFTDDGATVLAICDSRKTANAVLREHKHTRDTGAEFENRANWWVRRERVCTANDGLEPRGNRVGSEPLLADSQEDKR
jgi:hypothetical protein